MCAHCLHAVQGASAEYACRCCQTPFLNPYALNEETLCRLCRSGRSPVDAAHSFGWYEGSLRRLIHLYKYETIVSLAKPLGGMAVCALPSHERYDAVVPVPMHWRKRAERGFDQTWELAREVSRQTGIPVSRGLERLRHGKAQAGLSGKERRKSLVGAYAARPEAGLSGKSVLLVDDVWTTGSTVMMCAAELKRAGVSRVYGLTVARVDRRPLSLAS